MNTLLITIVILFALSHLIRATDFTVRMKVDIPFEGGAMGEEVILDLFSQPGVYDAGFLATATTERRGDSVYVYYKKSPLSCAEIERQVKLVEQNLNFASAGEVEVTYELLDCEGGGEFASGNSNGSSDFEVTGKWTILFTPLSGYDLNDAEAEANRYFQVYTGEGSIAINTVGRFNAPERRENGYEISYSVDSSQFYQDVSLRGASTEYGILQSYGLIDDQIVGYLAGRGVRIEGSTADALFGAVVLGEDWLWSPWIGVFYYINDEWPWIYVEATDSFWWIDRTSDNKGVSYYDSRDRDWKWVSPDSAPDVYNLDSGKWESGELN